MQRSSGLGVDEEDVPGVLGSGKVATASAQHAKDNRGDVVHQIVLEQCGVGVAVGFTGVLRGNGSSTAQMR